ncbi:MAG: hypothetical protein ACQSGP_10105, partial [Frankia sp.]
APKFAESQTLPDVSYADFAAGIGLAAERIDDPERIGPAWDAALTATVEDLRALDVVRAVAGVMRVEGGEA